MPANIDVFCSGVQYISNCTLMLLVFSQVMSVKALGIALKLTFEGTNQLLYPETWFFAVVVMTCILMQMNYLNKVSYFIGKRFECLPLDGV